MEGPTSEFHKSEEDKISGSAPELETGKQDFTGEILGTKWHTNDYGEALKMTVCLANGNRVWGTVPANIHESSEIQMRPISTAAQFHSQLPSRESLPATDISASSRDRHKLA